MDENGIVTKDDGTRMHPIAFDGVGIAQDIFLYRDEFDARYFSNLTEDELGIFMTGFSNEAMDYANKYNLSVHRKNSPLKDDVIKKIFIGLENLKSSLELFHNKTSSTYNEFINLINTLEHHFKAITERGKKNLPQPQPKKNVGLSGGTKRKSRKSNRSRKHRKY